MRNRYALIMLMSLCVLVPSSLAHADDLNNREPDHWRAGNWYNGYHAGHSGWWWIVDGSWTYYPTPVYPYPDPNAAVAIDAAPTVVETVAPAADAPLPAHYYCADPAGYYPSIPQCNVEWQKVDPGKSTGAASQDFQAQDVAEFELLENNFDAVDPTGQQAAAKLSDLGKQIEVFRQSLFQRDYNAMVLLEKTEILEHHVTEMQAAVARMPVPQPAMQQTAPADPASAAAAPAPPVDQNQPAPAQSAPEAAVDSAPQ